MSDTDLRKEDHLKICLEEDVQAKSVNTGFNEIHFIHRCLPEAAIEDIQLSTQFFKHTLSAPIIIEAMTGGTRNAARINETLAHAAETLGLAMGVGSQRVALENPKVAYSFKIARETAPHAFLIANLGAPQIKEYKLPRIQEAIDMIEADALTIHLNALQEAIQPEGEPNFEGLLTKIGEIASSLSLPVIIKETGAGIAYEDAKLLEKIGVAGLDIAGAGGTSWAAVEAHRARIRGNMFHTQLGHTFWDWGIPTAVSVVETTQASDLIVIASGGLRTGIDVAKAIALGADHAGFAGYLLKPASEGNVDQVLERIMRELKTTMFLVGAKSINDLKQCPLIITGKTAQWLKTRSFPTNYAKRKHD